MKEEKRTVIDTDGFTKKEYEATIRKPDSEPSMDNIESEKLVEVNISASSIMTLENYEKFAKIFSKNFHEMSFTRSEKFSINGNHFKLYCLNGKYKVGMVFKIDLYDDFYWMITRINEYAINGELISEETLEMIHSFINSEKDEIPNDLLPYYGGYISRSFIYNDIGIIRNKINIDDKFKFIEELPVNFIYRLIPELNFYKGEE